jgi:hypothetical protein
MAQIDKLLTKWAYNTPREETKEKVISVLDRFFVGLYECKTGSHIRVYHPDLKGQPGFGPAGEFTVVISGGQRVKGLYVKRLAEVILSLGLREKEREDRKGDV